jgi:hypothetical protein
MRYVLHARIILDAKIQNFSCPANFSVFRCKVFESAVKQAGTSTPGYYTRKFRLSDSGGQQPPARMHEMKNSDPNLSFHLNELILVMSTKNSCRVRVQGEVLPPALSITTAQQA